MRLNKYISHNSKYSRREADALIEAGEVTVNKVKMDNFGYDVKDDDQVSIRGLHVKPKTELTMIVYNKPKGTLVTQKDDRGRTTIFHKLPGKFRHFIPVGRLDFASEGLLLLTDSPRVAEVMMQSGLDRTYNIKIDKPFSPEMEEAMREGLYLDDARAGGHEQSKIYSMEFAPFVHYEVRGVSDNFTKLRVTIAEGKNRELRRFFGHFEANVLDLKRVAFGGIELNNLPTNKTRYFTRREYDDTHKYLKMVKQIEAQEAKEEEDRVKADRLREKKKNQTEDQARRAKSAEEKRLKEAKQKNSNRNNPNKKKRD
ncbi:MAG: Ribosomal large subunit pseudouridine synthase B (EC [uncultured Sulfurovum sp.]|uniref:Pseudouridine synthase n=1 Tax=uncultured Sulfurovum sp. TaxID=269237 RepID=A0A6S6UFV4_9BACT|nr:MAG: Ribosomal large subunit pseudouridine synthase B (EC [uncultured Sulfurovum sp.]